MRTSPGPSKPNQVIDSKRPQKAADTGTDMHSAEVVIKSFPFQQLEPEEDVTLSIEIHSGQVDRL